MKKRILTMFLSVCILLSIIVVPATAEFVSKENLDKVYISMKLDSGYMADSEAMNSSKFLLNKTVLSNGKYLYSTDMEFIQSGIRKFKYGMVLEDGTIVKSKEFVVSVNGIYDIDGETENDKVNVFFKNNLEFGTQLTVCVDGKPVMPYMCRTFAPIQNKFSPVVNTFSVSTSNLSIGQHSIYVRGRYNGKDIESNRYIFTVDRTLVISDIAPETISKNDTQLVINGNGYGLATVIANLNGTEYNLEVLKRTNTQLIVKIPEEFNNLISSETVVVIKVADGEKSVSKEVVFAKRTDVLTGVDAVVARADYLYGITWTAKKDRMGWTNSKGIQTRYIAGKEYHIPYGQPYDDGNATQWVGWGCSISSFLEAASNANSVFYEKDSYKGAPYYALDCSSFVRYCWGTAQRGTETELYNNGQVEWLGTCSFDNVNIIRVGDALRSSAHVVLVTRIYTNENGEKIFEITHQTNPQMERFENTAAELINNYGSYTISRYKYINQVTFETSSNTLNLLSAYNDSLIVEEQSIESVIEENLGNSDENTLHLEANIINAEFDIKNEAIYIHFDKFIENMADFHRDAISMKIDNKEYILCEEDFVSATKSMLIIYPENFETFANSNNVEIYINTGYLIFEEGYGSNIASVTIDNSTLKSNKWLGCIPTDVKTVELSLSEEVDSSLNLQEYINVLDKYNNSIEFSAIANGNFYAFGGT